MFINQDKKNQHSYFMKLALNQAGNTLGNTNQNPAVGCVIVKNNSLISAGFTSINGRPHAEQNAVDFSKANLKNSNLYVTLEPCSHYGQTPPCVNTIIKKKIKNIFFSINDPDIRSYNKSTKILKKKGINVKKGINEREINFFYSSYIQSKKKLLPFVTYKLAISKDFYTAKSSKNKLITNNYSRSRVHLMRSLHDCLITSSRTIIEDNPRLTCRINGLENRSPARIILDRKLEIPLNSKVIKESKTFETIIFYNKENKKKINLLKQLKIKTYKISLNKYKKINLKETLLKAKKLGFTRIFLECGITLGKSFFNEKLINNFNLFISKNNVSQIGRMNVKSFLRKVLKYKKKNIINVNLFGDKLILYKFK
jgi:diaminohydroxyphosphoribosylaminopyrimidine deaminase / 5-amino-6-(5-phosphoribosylamino)uracil reductase